MKLSKINTLKTISFAAFALFLSSCGESSNNYNFDERVEAILAENNDGHTGRFVPGEYAGLLREYKGGIGEGESRVVMIFSDDEITSIAIDTHLTTAENPTPEIDRELEARALEAQGFGFEYLEAYPYTSSNFAQTVAWTMIIAENRMSPVQAFAPANIIASNSHNLEDGIHFNTVPGRNDELTVGLEVEEGIITRAVVIHRDTPGIVDAGVNTIVNTIVNEQTTNVDIFAGATNTSNAIIAALQGIN
ncbi:MAG: FMN-binding protein [Defluviitaleaceae bacterium]|nr:FMN-binding protein [Defluviitaleaceae bacterium]